MQINPGFRRDRVSLVLHHITQSHVRRLRRDATIIDILRAERQHLGNGFKALYRCNPPAGSIDPVQDFSPLLMAAMIFVSSTTDIASCVTWGLTSFQVRTVWPDRCHAVSCAICRSSAPAHETNESLQTIARRSKPWPALSWAMTPLAIALASRGSRADRLGMVQC